MTTTNLPFRFLFVGFLLALTACSNPLGDDKSKIDVNYGPVNPALTGYEVVSGSKLATTSLAGTHKVDATIGATTTEIKLTTARNKIVYLSVQGQMISK